MAGLWNEDFRPLRCPLPMLAIRHMVPTDFAFLKGKRELMETYLAAFGDTVPAALAEQVHAAAVRFGLRPGEEASPGAGAPAETEPRAAADPEPRAATDVEPRAAAEAACPHHAAAAVAECPAHADAGAASVERVPVGRIVSEDVAGAGV
jgi:hypothetical protein